jgi:hypothetical protein
MHVAKYNKENKIHLIFFHGIVIIIKMHPGIYKIDLHISIGLISTLMHINTQLHFKTI